ncbi:MAG: dTDP-4-amino-4,6-dideoxygalactose transaminase [Parvibaculum sp.]|nr:dTDP-4-amino-4,6-dideoxygalactose transaminase [Parvibaculum sp.]
MDKIPFNRTHLTGREIEFISTAFSSGQITGDGPFTKKCEAWLEKSTGTPRALLTHSCTAALEMAALLAGIAPGDEVILPSYTFVSTANAFVLRGGVPVFIDVRADTINIDENLIEAAITPRTRAIVPVHYAGVSCAMDEINAIAEKHNLLVIEDTAQGIGASYRGRALGTLGNLGALSFHATKNIVSGEGGALLINDRMMNERAEIIREKGTDRSRFIRGEVDKYTWQDVGSSFLPSDIIAATLMAQLPETEAINARRLAIWSRYHAAFAEGEQAGRFRRPGVPQDCGHNAHIYYLVFNSLDAREQARTTLAEAGIVAATHYVPLHEAPAARRLGRAHGTFAVCDSVAAGLLRLPLYPDLSSDEQTRVIEAVQSLQV